MAGNNKTRNLMPFRNVDPETIIKIRDLIIKLFTTTR